MAKIQIEIDVPIRCVCGQNVDQVNNSPNRSIHPHIITVKICHKCAEQIRSEAYNKGLEYGRKAKD